MTPTREEIAEAAEWLFRNRQKAGDEWLRRTSGASICAVATTAKALDFGRPDGAQQLRQWWGLSYATWLVMPRVLLEAMPEEWQARLAVLLKEYGAAFPQQPDLGTTVRTTQNGKLVRCPGWLLNYRHPSADEIRKCRGE